jgi:hypothetical protein
MSENRFDPLNSVQPDGSYRLDERAEVGENPSVSPGVKSELERLAGMTYEEVLADLLAKPVSPRRS